MTVWVAAFALGAIAAALLPLVIFCASYLTLGILAVAVSWLSGTALLHGAASVVLDLIALQIGYGLGFSALAAFTALKNWLAFRSAKFETPGLRQPRSTLRERLDRRRHSR